MQAVRGALGRGEPHLGALARVPSVMNGPPKPKCPMACGRLLATFEKGLSCTSTAIDLLSEA